ncbi:MAG: transposase [Anaerolineae bacterium]
MQSPHDGDATYRIKGGKRFRGGYVINVSETVDPENSIQLITDVQVQPNQTDDATLMEQSLDDQAEREIGVDRVTTDGGYTGPQGEAACEKHKVELRATRMRGGRSAADKWGWEEYTWEVDDEGRPIRVTCPQGCTAGLVPGQAQGRFIARFAPECCADCPFFKNQCRVQDRQRVGPTLYVQSRTIEVAQQRQSLHPEDTSIRVLAESTVRSLKRAFPNNKLPVRGLIRSRMMIYPAAVMVNVRGRPGRLHGFFTEIAQEASQEVASSLFSVRNAVCHHLNRVYRRLSRHPLVRHAQRAMASLG